MPLCIAYILWVMLVELWTVLDKISSAVITWKFGGKRLYWMQARCSDLQELDREGDAASIYMEFRLKGIG